MPDVEFVHPVPVEDAADYVLAMTTPFLEDPTSPMTQARVENIGRVWQPERRWAARARGRIVATLGSRELSLTVPGTGGDTGEIAADGLTAVTVAATHRRQGLLTALLTDSLHAAKERGDPVSILIAAEYPIYGRFGYAPAEQLARFTLRPRLPGGSLAPDGKGSVYQVEREEFGAVAPAIFDRARRQRAGNIDREPAWWRMVYGLDGWPAMSSAPQSVCVLHETDGRPDGYVVWKPARDFDTTGDLGAIAVRDLQAETPEAYRALWAYLSGIDAIEEVTLDMRPVDEPARWLLPDARALRRTYSGDGVWLRFLDVPAALAARRYATSGRLVLEIVDPDVGGYAAGTFRLDGGPDGAECVPAPGGSADLRVSQRGLAATYLGGHSLREQLLAGGVDELTPGAIDRADAMLATALAPWCATGF